MIDMNDTRVGESMPKNKVGHPIVSDYDLIISDWPTRARALKEVLK
jgi:hypothetical protein